jgi:hypothetical protein
MSKVLKIQLQLPKHASNPATKHYSCTQCMALLETTGRQCVWKRIGRVRPPAELSWRADSEWPAAWPWSPVAWNIHYNWSIYLNGRVRAGSRRHKGRFNENTTSGCDSALILDFFNSNALTL